MDCGESLDKNCLILGFSELLGVLILVGSLFLRVPQILSIFKAKNAAGVSVNMYHLENIVCIIAAAYGFRTSMPFDAYGESYSLLIQNCIIIAQIHIYDEKVNPIVLILTICWFCLFLNIIPVYVLNWLIVFVPIPINIFSRLPQIWKLYIEGSVGAVSLLMFVVSTCGSLARIFTTITEVSDVYILIGCISSFLLNATITAQLFYYKMTTK